MLPKLIDNSRRSLRSVIEGISPNYEQLSIATGYWDILGTQLIFDSIRDYKKIRLLIGREPLISRHGILRPEPDYPDQDFFRDLERLDPCPDLKLLVQNLKKLIEGGTLEVKVYKKSFFHAKSYIFGDYESPNAIGIIGSSNFTKNGLTQNTELNALESDHRIVTFCPSTESQELGHLFWFDQFWNSDYAKVWAGRFIEIISESPVGDVLFRPYETYIKTLYELYREELEDEKLENRFSATHDLLDFQVKNAQSLLRRLRKYKTAMLSDSVGLGKTYTAIEVIKQYLDTDEGRKRVEIICPKSLKEQWRTELTTQGVLNLEPVTLQNIDNIKKKRELDHIANVALFVIDESHNLKNRAGKRFREIVEWIRNNAKAHVLMLTATPISNQLNDIANQLLLGTGGEADILTFPYTDKKTKQTINLNFHQIIEMLQKKIKRELKKENKIDEKHLREIMNPILRAFVVRRTRQGIQKEYGGLRIDGKECHFPEVRPHVEKYNYKKETTNKIVRGVEKNKYFDPRDIYQIPINVIVDNTKTLIHPIDNIEKMKERNCEVDIEKKSPIYLMYQVILLLNFIPYKWRTYQKRFYGKTRDELKELNLSSDESRNLFLQIGIYGILRTMFLKRIESSIYAFEKSLTTYENKLDLFGRGFKAGKVISVKNLESIEKILGSGDDDIDPDDLEELDNEEILDDNVTRNTYEVDALLGDIQKEKLLISLLRKKIEIFRLDNAKMESFINLIKRIKQKEPDRKVLIFSYYADTINFLERALFKLNSPINKENTGFLSSKNRKDAESLASKFSPKSKKYILKNGEKEIKYLFSTDILSEGQNLQDCGIVINYDLHWSPVRMIQRNGRINRLGTPFREVYVYNISPEEQLEEYLRLIHRLEAKIKLIKSTIGTDTPVLDEDENPLEFTDTLVDIYSEELQKRMEAMSRAEKDADFLLAEDEYISDLKSFHNDQSINNLYRERIYNISMGKWCVMPVGNLRGRQNSSRPRVLTFSSLFDKDHNLLGHAFISTDRKGRNIEFVSNLQALEWLRVSSIEDKRQSDNISLSKIKIKRIISQISKSYVVQEESAPEPQQQEVLRVMYQNHFSEEQIDSVRSSFRTTNVLDQQQVKKLVRKVMQAHKKGKVDSESIGNLISLSREISEEKIPKVEIEETKQVLFYVKENN